MGEEELEEEVQEAGPQAVELHQAEEELLHNNFQSSRQVLKNSIQPLFFTRVYMSDLMLIQVKQAESYDQLYRDKVQLSEFQ